MKQALIGIGSGLAAGSLALGLLFVGPLSQSNEVSEQEASQTALPDATVSAAPVESESEPTEPEVIQCSVSKLEDAAEILSLQAQVINSETGEVLFDRGSGSAARPASIMKLFTAAAALETLGPGYQVTTGSIRTLSNPAKSTWLVPVIRRFLAPAQIKIRSIKKLPSYLTLPLKSRGSWVKNL